MGTRLEGYKLEAIRVNRSDKSNDLKDFILDRRMS